MRKLIIILFALTAVFPEIASAHSFGTIYSLPVPVWLYIYTGGAIIFISFLLISIDIGELFISFLGILLFFLTLILSLPLPSNILLFIQILILLDIFFISGYFLNIHGKNIGFG